jgi:hypothetical protein
MSLICDIGMATVNANFLWLICHNCFPNPLKTKRRAFDHTGEFPEVGNHWVNRRRAFFALLWLIFDLRLLMKHNES